MTSIFSRRAVVCISLLFLCLGAADCSRKPSVSADGRVKVRVGWIGLVCEAPIFAAYENGYFKDEGLDCELVKTDWDSFQAGMSFDRFDATHTLVTYLLKPIEKGLDIKMTGGVHKGCLRIQAGVKTNIHTIEDLRGKKIAVSTIGGPPMIFASRVLSSRGIDVQKEISWVVYPGDITELALNKGQVDAVADSEPIGSLLLNQKCVRTIVDQMIDAPYREEFCCVVVISGKIVREDPKTAAKLTRAIMRGSKWVGLNPRAAARIEVEKRYISKADVELNAAVLTKLQYTPQVSSCRQQMQIQCAEMKKAGVLSGSTDAHALAERAWQSLDGVSDEWIGNVPVQIVEGGGPVPTVPAVLARLVAQAGHPPCCNRCCAGE